MITKGGVRCDGCGKLAQGEDKFAGFFLPPNGNFPGIARQGAPKELVQLHGCPVCNPKINFAMAMQKVSLLPSGPLKQIMEQLTAPKVKLILPGQDLRRLH